MVIYVFEPHIREVTAILERIENPEGFLQREYAVDLIHGVENLLRVPTVLFRDDLTSSQWNGIDVLDQQEILDKFIKLSSLASEIHAKAFSDIPARLKVNQSGIDQLFGVSEYAQWVAARLQRDDIRKLPLDIVARFSVLALEAFQSLSPLFTNLQLEGYKVSYYKSNIEGGLLPIDRHLW